MNKNTPILTPEQKAQVLGDPPPRMTCEFCGAEPAHVPRECPVWGRENAGEELKRLNRLLREHRDELIAARAMLAGIQLTMHHDDPLWWDLETFLSSSVLTPQQKEP